MPAPTYSRSPLISDQDYNVHPLLRNGRVPNLPIGATVGGLHIGLLELPNVFQQVNTFSGVRFGTRIVTEDFTFSVLDHTVAINATAGIVNGKLPAALGTGQVYRADKLDSVNPALILPEGSDTINGGTVAVLSVQNHWIMLVDVAVGQWTAALPFELPSNVPRLNLANVFTESNFFQALRLGARIVTADDNITALDYGVYADAGSNPIALPLPETGTGQIVRIKKIDTSGNIVTVIAQSGDLIDGAVSVNLVGQFAECWLYSPYVGYWDNMVAVPESEATGLVPLVGYDALREVESEDLVVQTELRIVTRLTGGLWTGSGWFLIAGTNADDDDTVLRPNDYATTTNEKVWVKVWGF